MCLCHLYDVTLPLFSYRSGNAFLQPLHIKWLCNLLWIKKKKKCSSSDVILSSKVLICCSCCDKSSLTLCNPMDCSPPASSVHGILQARTLEWVVISFSRGSSWPRDWTLIFYVSCTGRQILNHAATWEVQYEVKPKETLKSLACY